MKWTRLAAVGSSAVFTAAGLGAGTAITACGSTAQAPAVASTPPSSGYSYYQSMMGRLYGDSPGMMMGRGTPARTWMTGTRGFRWMTGGLAAPAWMRGQDLPGFMMGSSTNPGQVMGTLFARAPGARISPAAAARLGTQIPSGAAVSRDRNRVTFSAVTARLDVVASPAGGPDETFRIAGLTNPTIVVTAGTRVSLEVINADPGTAHGLVITASHAAASWMPMMTARPAFAGSALWFLGDPTSAGLHAATLSFTASTPGTYRYLCAVPGHAQQGMTGLFIVA